MKHRFDLFKRSAALALVLVLLLGLLAGCAASGLGGATDEDLATKPESGENLRASGTEEATRPESDEDLTEPATAETVPATEAVPTTEAVPATEAGTEPTEAPTEPSGALTTATLFGQEADWCAEVPNGECWSVKALTLFTDGTLYYDEGAMFSEFCIFYDGTWTTEDDSTLVLTLWPSPYDEWPPPGYRPPDWQVDAAAPHADSFTVRYACEPAVDGVTLTQRSEQGFPDDREGTTMFFHARSTDYGPLSAELLCDILERDAAQTAQLRQTDDPFELLGWGGMTRFAGVNRSGTFDAILEHTEPVTISEEELTQAKESGMLELQGKNYRYSTEQDVPGTYGMIYELGRDAEQEHWFWILRAGDRYYFVHEIGGVTTRLEEITETWWMTLDPDTPVVLGPSPDDDTPRTLREYGPIHSGTIAAPFIDEQTGRLCIYVDMR